MAPDLATLNRDIYIKINSQRIFVCAFTLEFIDDISQQLDNRELLRQSATHRYDYYLISSSTRDDLKYDIIKNERYYRQLKNARASLSSIKIKERKIFMKAMSLSVEDTPLIKIALAFNLIQIKPSNVNYFEYREIEKIF